MSYCKNCRNWHRGVDEANYCAVFCWLSDADDFCSFEDREPEQKKGENVKHHKKKLSNICSNCGANTRGYK